MERSLGVLPDGKLNRSQQCALEPKGPIVPGGQQAQHCQWAKQGVVPSALCCMASPAALSAVWVSPYRKDVKPWERNRGDEQSRSKVCEEWLRS